MSGSAPPVALIRLLAATCTGLAVLAGLLTGWGDPGWAAVPVLAVAVAASEIAVVHLQFGRQRWTFSLTEAVIGAAYVWAQGAWVPLAVALGVTVAQRVRAQPTLKLQYNVAQLTAAAAVGAVLSGLAGGGVLGACAGLAGFWAVNYLMVAVVVDLTSDRPLRALLAGSAPLSAVHTAGNSSIGLLAAHLALTAPLGLLGLLVPMALLWTSYDQSARRSGEARLFAELARGQERAAGRSTDVSAEVVLTAAARLFGGADVEMVLLAAEGPVRYVGDEAGEPRRAKADRNAFDEPWVLRALGAGRVATGVEDGRPWCSVVLGEPGAPMAVLVARRTAGAASFGRLEVRLARVLAGQAEAWLSVADLSARNLVAAHQVAVAGDAARALGDLGARTTPALAVLHESAGRLTRLTESSAGVEDIVEELHLVERAVASLLGAVALAAEPDLLSLPRPAGPARQASADDWTTTGLLT